MTRVSDERILRRNEVASLVGVSKATLYRMIQRGEFPRPIKISPRLSGWRSAEIAEWLDSRQRAKPWTGSLAERNTS